MRAPENGKRRPGQEGGVGPMLDSAGAAREYNNRVTEATAALSAGCFPTSQSAAMALLLTSQLRPREGQFAGGLAFSADALTPKQANWLRILLDRYELPELEGEA